MRRLIILTLILVFGLSLSALALSIDLGDPNAITINPGDIELNKPSGEVKVDPSPTGKVDFGNNKIEKNKDPGNSVDTGSGSGFGGNNNLGGITNGSDPNNTILDSDKYNYGNKTINPDDVKNIEPSEEWKKENEKNEREKKEEETIVTPLVPTVQVDGAISDVIVYPSPFSISRDQKANIQYYLADDTDVTLYIVSVSGKII